MDYEDMILARQEQMEIDEFNWEISDDLECEEHYNPVLLRMIEEARNR